MRFKPTGDRIRLGVSYYPEQWPKERWQTDARLMREAGISIARMAEFAWSVMEPREGQYDFAWLDEAIEILDSCGIKTVLGTPTNAPPTWLIRGHPEILPVTREGNVIGWGRRGNYCANSPLYRKYTRQIVVKMADRYGANPQVVGWQTDNEFRANRCYCENCDLAFREWLKAKYRTIDKLNEQWGTIYHNQIFTDWDQVETPKVPDDVRLMGFRHGASILLDYYRFASESTASYHRLQADLIRARTQTQFVSHNFIPIGAGEISEYEFASALTFVSWDSYRPLIDDRPIPQHRIALNHDYMRSLKNGPYWMLEQQCGHFNYGDYRTVPRAEEVRLWCYDAVAHGADAVVFYRWRGGRFGLEQNANSLLRHDGTPRIGYEAVLKLRSELEPVAARLAKGVLSPQCAIVIDYKQRWAMQTHTLNKHVSYQTEVERFYFPFWRLSVPVDCVGPLGELSRYSLVAAPAVFSVSQETSSWLESYVAEGGTLVLSLPCGIKTASNVTTAQPMPAFLDKLVGIRILEFDSQPPDYKMPVELLRSSENRTVAESCFDAGYIGEQIELKEAQAIGRFTGGLFSGQPAVTRHQYGKGSVYYVATIGTQRFYTALIEDIIEKCAVQRLLEAPEGVQVTARRTNNETYLFVLNFTAEIRKVGLNETYTNLLTGQHVRDALYLDPFGVAVIVKAGT